MLQLTLTLERGKKEENIEKNSKHLLKKNCVTHILSVPFCLTQHVTVFL